MAAVAAASAPMLLPARLVTVVIPMMARVMALVVTAVHDNRHGGSIKSCDVISFVAMSADTNKARCMEH